MLKYWKNCTADNKLTISTELSLGKTFIMNGLHMSASFWNQFALKEYRSNSGQTSDCKIEKFFSRLMV